MKPRSAGEFIRQLIQVSTGRKGSNAANEDRYPPMAHVAWPGVKLTGLVCPLIQFCLAMSWRLPCRERPPATSTTIEKFSSRAELQQG